VLDSQQRAEQNLERVLDVCPGFGVRVEPGGAGGESTDPVGLVIDGQLDLATSEQLQAVLDGLIDAGRCCG
jgi:hypothetical protein